jgi:diguanylate cyclase (GGDEF)-like protein
LRALKTRMLIRKEKTLPKTTLRGIFEENARLRKGTTKDPMTGYANFQGLREAVEQERSRIERGQSKGFVLVALDLDKFKQVNDTYGHAAGDEVIIEFANRLGAKLRPVDTLCRKSGDEFWVLATGTTIAEFKPIFDQTLLDITKDPMIYEANSIAFRASHGYGEYGEQASLSKDIMKQCRSGYVRDAKKTGNAKNLPLADLVHQPHNPNTEKPFCRHSLNAGERILRESRKHLSNYREPQRNLF